jgi:hypothetical protein
MIQKQIIHLISSSTTSNDSNSQTHHAKRMAQRWIGHCAAMKVVIIKSWREEFVLRTNIIDVKGGVVTRNQCSVEGCTKYVQKSEVCTNHGAKMTRKQMQCCWMYQSSSEGRNLYYTWRETNAGAALMGCPNQVQ